MAALISGSGLSENNSKSISNYKFSYGVCDVRLSTI